MKIQESAENYLETILILSERSTYVRSIDIANELNFTKPSVSVAMKKLRENNLITVDGDGNIHLPKDIATEDSCRIEHVISQDSFEKIRAHVRKMNEHL